MVDVKSVIRNMKNPKLIQGQLYLIQWEDTWSFIRWRDIDEIKKLATEANAYIKTVGFYIGTFDNYITLSGSFNTNPEMSDWGMITYIPRGSICKITKLNEKN